MDAVMGLSTLAMFIWITWYGVHGSIQRRAAKNAPPVSPKQTPAVPDYARPPDPMG